MLEKEWDKLAEEKRYFKEVISPFAEKASAKILHDKIKKFAGREKSAIDLGTGLGKLLPFLSKNFKLVKAVDYSQKMIDFAERANKKLKNVSFEKMDMRKMPYRNLFDAAVAVNSVIASSVKEADRIIKNIHSLLKKGGVLVGIFPSLESILYCAMLVYEKQLKSHPLKIARDRTVNIIESWDYDFLLGFLNEKGGKQKHFYEFELEYRLKKSGFKKIEIEKIHYPWKVLEDKDRNFPGKEPVWDWLVVARR